MSFLQLNGISKNYGSGEQQAEVLNDVNLSIEEGEFVAIVGFSGSGKTTLISTIAGLIQPDAGEVLFKGSPSPGRRRIEAWYFKTIHCCRG